MSFDLGILSAAAPLDADEAARIYASLCEGKPWNDYLKEDREIERFIGELSQTWPDIDSLPGEQIDQSPWAGGFEISPAHVILTMRWSADDSVIKEVTALAERHRLNVFDPQDGTLYRPGKPPAKASAQTQSNAKSLICEACGKQIEPDEPRVERIAGRAVIMHMTCMLKMPGAGF